MNNDLISIIIPVYNTKIEYLKECFDSINNQKSNNYEVIIIDDGSVKSIKNYCINYCKNKSKFKFYSKKNEGVSSSRNYGINKSNGKYIIFIDSDDYIDSETIKNINKYICDDIDIFIFDNIAEYKNKKIINHYFKNNIELFDENNIKEMILQIININSSKYKPKDNCVGNICSKLYKKEFIIKNKLRFDKNIKRAEDHLFLLNCINNNPNIKYIQYPYYHIRKNSYSTVNKYDNNLDKKFKLTLNELYKYVKKLNNKIYFDAYYARSITYLVLIIKNNYFHKNNKDKLYIKINKLKRLINDKEFKSSIDKVNKKYLNNKQRIILHEIKIHNYLFIYFICKIYNLIYRRKVVV